mmetsp:Transcript_143368/g.267218  ORF Transcript_143368/g.267218 Transcript_143368/m.267218 type:complete len:283 (+) Transcript_143368:180-1028(+)
MTCIVRAFNVSSITSLSTRERARTRSFKVPCIGASRAQRALCTLRAFNVYILVNEREGKSKIHPGPMQWCIRPTTNFVHTTRHRSLLSHILVKGSEGKSQILPSIMCWYIKTTASLVYKLRLQFPDRLRCTTIDSRARGSTCCISSLPTHASTAPHKKACALVKITKTSTIKETRAKRIVVVLVRILFTDKISTIGRRKSTQGRTIPIMLHINFIFVKQNTIHPFLCLAMHLKQQDSIRSRKLHNIITILCLRFRIFITQHPPSPCLLNISLVKPIPAQLGM